MQFAGKTKMPWRLIMAALIGIGVLVSLFASSGTTTTSQLNVGDCFETPGDGDFTHVTEQDCAGAHDVQIYAQIDVDRSNEFTTGDECAAELVGVLAANRESDSIVLPDDTRINQIRDVEPSGLGTVYCTLESRSGTLVGSVLPSG